MCITCSSYCDSKVVKRCRIIYCAICKYLIACLRKSYNLAELNFGMEEEAKRTMPVCLTSDQLKVIEEYAKRKGMLNASQAIEDLITRK
jgi:hypothetical protein